MNVNYNIYIADNITEHSFLSRPSHTHSDIIDITTTSRETARYYYYYFVCVSGSRVFGKIQARAHMTQMIMSFQ